jgi:uncharacterized protein (DUF2164 family)
MSYSIKIKRGESIIYIVLWLVILLMPVFISKTDSGINWSRVQHEWIRFLPFLIVFVVHNYFLFPRFFIHNKRILYFLLTIILILLVGFFADFIVELFNLRPGDTMRMPQNDPMHIQGPPIGTRQVPRGPEPWHKMFIDNTLVSILVVGFNSAIKLTVKWQEEEQKNKELEKEKLQTELAFLKNQVSPHFFMNTLNNIHALIDINSEDAKESIIKLSKLMRYLLYDSEQGKTTLPKEIEFIKSYVDLMRMRFTSDVDIKLSFPETTPDIEIPPMLFTSLLENAFKHGISYQSNSFVGIYMKIHEKQLFFRIKNSMHKNNGEHLEKGGLGLPNLNKRLELLYGSDFTLSNSENENTFEINVKIPLHGN